MACLSPSDYSTYHDRMIGGIDEGKYVRLVQLLNLFFFILRLAGMAIPMPVKNLRAPIAFLVLKYC